MTAVIAAYSSEAALVHAVDRLRTAGLEAIETYAPLPVELDEQAGRGSFLPVFALGGGVFGAGFMFFLETLSTATSWGYPVDIGGRPAFSWPAYIPIAVAFGILCAATAALLFYLIAASALRLWDPVDEFDALRTASRDGWIVHVHSEDEHMIHRARAVLGATGPVAMRMMSDDLEEVPA